MTSRRPTLPWPLLAALGLVALALLMAGVPGADEPVAGEGSEALRKGWAAARAAEVQEPAKR